MLKVGGLQGLPEGSMLPTTNNASSAATTRGAPPSTASIYGQHKEPVFGIIYSPSGAGKSSACCFAFPHAFFIGPQGGVTKVARSVVGLPVETGLPRTDEGKLLTVDKICQVLPTVAAAGYRAVVIDDITVIGERTSAALGQIYSKRGGDVYERWEAVANQFMLLRDTARALSIHVILNAHPLPPWVDKQGIRQKGGPALPGRVTPLRFPPVADFVYRAVVDLAWPDPEWHGYFECDPTQPDWYTKDRHDAFGGQTKAPMNLGEILRAAGYDIPRLAGLEWQEALVEVGANAVVAGAAFETVWVEVAAQARTRFVAGWAVEAAYCALRWTRLDLYARSYLKLVRAQRYRAYGL